MQSIVRQKVLQLVAMSPLSERLVAGCLHTPHCAYGLCGVMRASGAVQPLRGYGRPNIARHRLSIFCNSNATNKCKITNSLVTNTSYKKTKTKTGFRQFSFSSSLSLRKENYTSQVSPLLSRSSTHLYLPFCICSSIWSSYSCV